MGRLGWGWQAAELFLCSTNLGTSMLASFSEAEGRMQGVRGFCGSQETLGDSSTKAPAAGDNAGCRKGLFVRRWLLASWEAGEAG